MLTSKAQHNASRGENAAVHPKGDCVSMQSIVFHCGISSVKLGIYTGDLSNNESPRAWFIAFYSNMPNDRCSLDMVKKEHFPCLAEKSKAFINCFD